MKDMQALQVLIYKAHKPEQEIFQEDLIYQVWNDGKITIQRGKDKSWKNHMVAVELGDKSKAIPPRTFPCVTNVGDGFAYATKEDCQMISRIIKETM